MLHLFLAIAEMAYYSEWRLGRGPHSSVAFLLFALFLTPHFTIGTTERMCVKHCSSFYFNKGEMDFIFANRVEDVLRAAFDDEFSGIPQAVSSKPLSSKL